MQDGPARERQLPPPDRAGRAHGGKARGTGKAVGKQAVVNFALPRCRQQHGGGQRRSVGGKGRPGVGPQVCPAPQRHGGVTGQPHAVSDPADLHAGPGQKAQKRVIAGRVAARNFDLSARARQCGGVGRGGDTVRQRAVKGSAQRSAALHGQHRRARALNIRPAGRQKRDHVADLRLLRSAAQHGLPRGAAGGHQQGHCGPDAGQPQCKIHPMQRPRAPQRDGDALQFDLGPHGGQPGQVDVHGSRAEAAAPGQRQAHIADAAEQRREIKYRAAHGPGQMLRDVAAEMVRGTGAEVRPAAPHPGSDSVQQRQAGVHVGQTRDVPQAAGTVAEQRRRQQRQGAVFGGGRPDAAVQGASAVDGDRLHERGLLNL